MHLRGREDALAGVVARAGQVAQQGGVRGHPVLQSAPGVSRCGVWRIETGQLHPAERSGITVVFMLFHRDWFCILCIAKIMKNSEISKLFMTLFGDK